jgi:hypothetical protein
MTLAAIRTQGLYLPKVRALTRLSRCVALEGRLIDFGTPLWNQRGTDKFRSRRGNIPPRLDDDSAIHAIPIANDVLWRRMPAVGFG